jgi:hypothetical protein
MHVFNIAQALLWICNYHLRKFDEAGLNAKLAHLAKPVMFGGCKCTPSLSEVAVIFAKGVPLSDATDTSIQEASRASRADPAKLILLRALDDLKQKLLAGALAISGRQPGGNLEIIPALAFRERQFVDHDGIEAVHMDFPVRTFPRWRDLSALADDVRRLWPAEPHGSGADETEADTGQLDKKTGRPRGTGYAASDAPLVAKMIEMVDDGTAKSCVEAARMLLGRDGSNAAGNGSVDAKIARLVKRARAAMAASQRGKTEEK